MGLEQGWIVCYICAFVHFGVRVARNRYPKHVLLKYSIRSYYGVFFYFFTLTIIRRVPFLKSRPEFPPQGFPDRTTASCPLDLVQGFSELPEQGRGLRAQLPNLLPLNALPYLPEVPSVKK